MAEIVVGIFIALIGVFYILIKITGDDPDDKGEKIHLKAAKKNRGQNIKKN